MRDRVVTETGLEPPADPNGACAGKTGYLSWAAAHKILRHIRVKSSRRDQGKVAPYRCRYCACWHLGHSTR